MVQTGNPSSGLTVPLQGRRGRTPTSRRGGCDTTGLSTPTRCRSTDAPSLSSAREPLGDILVVFSLWDADANFAVDAASLDSDAGCAGNECSSPCVVRA